MKSKLQNCLLSFIPGSAMILASGLTMFLIRLLPREIRIGTFTFAIIYAIFPIAAGAVTAYFVHWRIPGRKHRTLLFPTALSILIFFLGEIILFAVPCILRYDDGSLEFECLALSLFGLIINICPIILLLSPLVYLGGILGARRRERRLPNNDKAT